MKQRKFCVSISSYHMLPYYKQINYVICCGHNFTSFYFKIALIISVEYLPYYKSLLCCLRVFGLKTIREKRNYRMFNKNDNYFLLSCINMHSLYRYMYTYIYLNYLNCVGFSLYKFFTTGNI